MYVSYVSSITWMAFFFKWSINHFFIICHIKLILITLRRQSNLDRMKHVNHYRIKNSIIEQSTMPWIIIILKKFEKSKNKIYKNVNNVNVDYQSELPELGGSNCSMLAAIPVLVITKLIWTLEQMTVMNLTWQSK